MKKILLFGLMIVFSIVIVGCNGDPTLVTTEAPTTIETTTEAPATNETTEAPTNNETTTETTTDIPATTDTPATTEETTTQAPTKQITLSYADWGDPIVNQLLIDEFMEKYPNISVVLRQDITGHGGAFTENLLNAQAAGVVPDVFAIDNVPVGYSNGMLLDITEFWDNDPETDLVYPNIQNTAIYNGVRYAMPSFQFIKGVFINLTLLDEYNIPVPEKDWTYDEFVALATQLRQAGIDDYVYGIEPVHYTGDVDFEAIWPTQDSANIGYQTWDGSQFNFTSQDWIDAYQAKLDLWAQDIIIDYGDLTAEEEAAYGGGSAFLQGYVGMSIQGSYELWYVDHMFDNYGYEVGFWPYPGGDAGQFPPTILDYIVVSSQTDHPEEAYLLAKWMSFGREGWLNRIDALEAQGITYLDRFPVADYTDVWDRIMYDDSGLPSDLVFYIEGVQESIDLLEFSKPDVDKWLPGYAPFWEWVGNDDNDYWTEIGDGLITPDVFASEWETKINEMVETALEEYE